MFIDIFYWHKVLGYSSQQLHKNNKKNALQKTLSRTLSIQKWNFFFYVIVLPFSFFM